jgi:hypothetical protein
MDAWAIRSSVKHPYLLLAAVTLLSTACAPIPTKESAVVYLASTPTFPYIGFDFSSADVQMVELDGRKIREVTFIALPSGKHSILVEANKGPNGWFGVAPFLGRCRSGFDVDLQAGKTYAFKFRRIEGSEIIQWMEKDTERIISKAPCIKVE